MSRLVDWLGDLRGRAALVVLGCLICQLGLGAGYVFSPLAPDLLAEFGWSRAEYSSARASQLLLLGLTSPLVGALVVRVGTRPILLVSTVVMGLVFLGFGQMQSYWQFALLVGVMGVTITGLGDVTVGQLVAQWVRKRRGFALGIVYTGSNLAGALLVPMVVGVSEAWGWRNALTSVAVMMFALMLPATLVLVREKRSTGEGEPSAFDGAPTGAAATLQREQPPDMPLEAALRTRSFWILAVTLFTFFFYFLGILEHFVLFLVDEGVDRAEAATYFQTAIFLGIFSKIALGLLADRMPERTTIGLDFALLAVSSLLLLLIEGDRSWLIWTFVFCYGFATAARDVVYPLIVTHCFGLRYMAEIYGAMMLALVPAGMSGPILAAALHDATGSYQVAFSIFAVVNLAAAVALLAVRDERLAGAR